MIDLRHHIYSLVAVFLALAIGMFIGKAFEPSSPVERQQSKIAHLNRIVERMDADFATIRDEVVSQQGQIKGLEGDLKRSDEFCRALVPVAVKGRLQWRNVAVIQTGDYGEDTTAIRTVLEQSGARVNSITQIKTRDDLMDLQKASQIATDCGLKADDQSCRTILKTVAAGAVVGADHNILVKLRDKGVLSLSGDYSRSSSCVVILGGSKSTDTSSKIDAQLIEEIRTMTSKVVGCEPVGAVVSYIPTYKKAGIASVDNIDKPFGQIGLVCALGGEVASFGVKDTADRLMPQTLGSKQ